MPVDMDALNMMNMMGGMDPSMGGMVPSMAMMAGASGQRQPNPTQYAQGYEIRRSLRQGLAPSMGARPRVPGTPPGAGGPSIGGGMDPSSMVDPGVANQALGQFGMQLPTHTNPFLFFNDRNQQGDPSWAGNHPKVAHAIEGAMIGATTPGGMTTGESISNVARTVLGIPGMYRNSQAAQMQAPFDMAKQVAGLQADQAVISGHLASAFHAYATGQAMFNKPDPVKPKQLYVAPDGSPYSFDTGTGDLSAAPGGPASGTLQRPGTMGRGPGSGAKLPPYVKTEADRLSYYDALDAGKKADSSFDGSSYDKNPPPGWSGSVIRNTAKLGGAAGGARAGATKAVDAAYGNLSDTQKQTLHGVDDEIKQAQTDLASAKKLTPIDSRQFEGDTYSARKANATKIAQDKLNQANTKRQTTLDGFNKPTYDNNGNRK